MKSYVNEGLLKDGKWGGKELNIKHLFHIAKEVWDLYKVPLGAMEAFRSIDGLLTESNRKGLISYESVDFENLTEEELQRMAVAGRELYDLFPYSEVVPDADLYGHLQGIIEESMRIDRSDLPSYLKVDWDGTLAEMAATFVDFNIDGEKYWFRTEAGDWF